VSSYTSLLLLATPTSPDDAATRLCVRTAQVGRHSLGRVSSSTLSAGVAPLFEASSVYSLVRLPHSVMPSFRLDAFLGRSAATSAADGLGISQLSVQDTSARARGLRLRGTRCRLAITPASMWPSASLNSVGVPEGLDFAAQCPLVLSPVNASPYALRRTRMTRARLTRYFLSVLDFHLPISCQLSLAH